MNGELGPVLRRARTAQKLTLKDIQHVTGVNNAYLSQLETGRIVKPGMGILSKLAPLYGVPLETMLQLSGQIEATEALVYPTELPDFILAASKVLSAGDWEALRGTVEWMMAHAGAEAQGEK
ncbi:helix-turn-helix domain-containing protein [Deinococcus humi]|uniref:Transcriptional regulator with XRE-family HTH domain n=1 Tax=Deinococcus humi TaxID=662880 RepID=A0A7W8JQF6_9DEIO|nr:helix-turn-helix transcriptional regulator [Deinococcus humi]MBB5361297.1 transcriptional regulator with XRE-family HTH domain [Deinococcus humi]GGO19366.1 hypothetical protein GCM10008949_03630 [Deinococcus humi]